MSSTSTTTTWYFYHLGLFHKEGYPIKNRAGRFETYKGITDNLQRRLRQHNKIIAGGAKSTSRRMGDAETSKDRVWKFLYVIGGFKCETHQKQIEFACKSDHTAYRTKMLPLDLRLRLKAVTSESSIVQTWEALHCNPWVAKGPDTHSIAPLVVYWCLPQYKPNVPTEQYLPSHYVKEEILTVEEKKQMLQVTEKERQWPHPPWL